jgi:hypothetical protein
MKRGAREMYFVDAAHFVGSAFLGYVGFWERLYISALAGRQRFNVLGALNANNQQLITVTNDTYINALSLCELLRQIAAIGHTSPVTLVLDNAKYQHPDSVFTGPTGLQPLAVANFHTLPTGLRRMVEL